jgi:hypothetical protein
MHTRLAVNGDLPFWATVLACVLALLSLGVLLAFELRRRERGGPMIVLTGLVAVVALLAAIARPVRIAARESVIGAKVMVLADVSRSMALPQTGKSPRADVRDAAVGEIAKKAKEARLHVLGFGDGAAFPLAQKPGEPVKASNAPRSDLTTAQRSHDRASRARRVGRGATASDRRRVRRTPRRSR